MKQKKYYAVFDGSDYLNSGLNCTTKEEVKEDILSLVEPEMDEGDFAEMEVMTIEQIVSVKGWQLHESPTKF